MMLHGIRAHVLADRTDDFLVSLAAARRALEGRFCGACDDEQALRLALEHRHLSELWDLLCSVQPLATATRAWTRRASAILVAGFGALLAVPAGAEHAVAPRSADGGVAQQARTARAPDGALQGDPRTPGRQQAQNEPPAEHLQPLRQAGEAGP